MKTGRPIFALAHTASVFAAGLTLAASSLSAQTIPKGDQVVDLENFARVPNSSGQPARINTLRSAPDGRIFANDQHGILYTISADGATVTPYLNLAAYVPLLQDTGERGFQSFAFHPDFNTPGTAGFGRFYTTASQSDTGTAATFTPGVNGAGRDHDEVLIEWTVADPNAATFVPADPVRPFREVLRIARPNGNHNAGYLSFNPTAGAGAERGNLYIGAGDSGGGGDPLGLAQMLGKVYGSILRINPLLPAAADPQRSTNGQYSIPADNPYVINPAFAREKFAAGFRNPQRFTWDLANGRMFVADIGQGRVEEIDVAQSGANYGWNQREGSYVYNNGSIGANVRGDTSTTGYTYPIAEYMHYSSAGNAVTTGPVYRGGGIPALDGRLLFSDFVNGVPYTLDANNLPAGGQSGITELRLRLNGAELSFLDIVRQVNASATRADLRFGSDAQNNVYFLDKQDGVIRRVVQQPIVDPPPVEVPVVSLTAEDLVVSRGAGRKIKITLTRTGDASQALAVPYLVGGHAVAGQDYRTLKGTKTIKAGKDTATIAILPLSMGMNGKVSVRVKPGDGFVVDPAARKVKISIVD